MILQLAEHDIRREDGILYPAGVLYAVGDLLFLLEDLVTLLFDLNILLFQKDISPFLRLVLTVDNESKSQDNNRDPDH